ncbi:alpha/beta hydrolase [Corynebacteriales bacterium D3-21]|uniref:Alpha/beta hydrolase n=1 Tax=Speluncibacter jeojiensis TaxID=2710754 RepID=A0A9X4M0S2_9ACTN|nr:alpha/beta hydrolase [Corynebacteriales bacterium D3-21]
MGQRGLESDRSGEDVPTDGAAGDVADAAAVATEPPARVERRPRHPFAAWAWSLVRLDFVGIVFAALFFCWSLTPSLLPRDWLFQGLIGGINAVIGYGVGVVIGWLVRRFVLARVPWWPLPDRAMWWLKAIAVTASIAASLLMLVWSAHWQRQLAALMDAEGTTTTGYIRTGVLSMLVAALLISLFRVLRDLVRWVARQINRLLKVPRPAANLLGLLVVLVLALTLVDGVLLRGMYAAANSVFGLQNNRTPSGIAEPMLPERSGSPESLAKWDTLGYEGKYFVARGLRADALSTANGTTAMQPIRVYVGLDSAPTAQQRADLMLAELERTGAFRRKALVVIPTTGTGWVNPTAAQAIELMYNGDTALVAMQYSYLPSWISFLADRDKAAAAGRLLFDTVYGKWSSLPEQARPKLYMYGESLGTQAGEGAFKGLGDIRSKTDGVLWVGPPNSNRLWRQFVDRRDPGSTEVSPVYVDGLVVRFINNPADLRKLDDQPWLEPHVLYIQHPSDPVVWWSPDLILKRPDWLSEPPGPDRLPAMKWFPFVTFWQVSADLANAAGVPDGHGHNYGTSVLDGWAAIAAPPGWTAQDQQHARTVLKQVMKSQGPEK